VFDFRKNFAFADNIRNDIVHMLIIRGMTFNIFGSNVEIQPIWIIPRMIENDLGNT
jgi:hypothetical protein